VLTALREQLVEQAAAEGLQPSTHARLGELGRTGNQSDLIHGEACHLQPGSILCVAREEIVVHGVGIEPPSAEYTGQRHPDRRDVPVTTHLGDEAPSRLEGAIYSGEHRVLTANPVQRCIGEDGIELGVKGQRFSIYHLCGQS
jgi:hypothetical protein